MSRELLEDLKRNVFCFVTYGSKELQEGRKKGEGETEGGEEKERKVRGEKKRSHRGKKKVSLHPLHATW